jgi:hypothetical protein
MLFMSPVKLIHTTISHEIDTGACALADMGTIEKRASIRFNKMRGAGDKETIKMVRFMYRP